MNLERRIIEGENIKQTAINLGVATLTTVGAYNLSGLVANVTPFNDVTDMIVTAGILAAGAIGGYKARSIFKKIRKRIKRDINRSRNLAEISKDEEFLQRQGIKPGKFGKIRKGLKYLLTVPLGGALGVLPGLIGVIPLCLYLGGHYNWEAVNTLASGEVAGAITGAYALTEMAAKKQYKRLVTTAFALAGFISGYFNSVADNSLINLSLEPLTRDIWSVTGICISTAIATGIIGNLTYKYLTNYEYKKQYEEDTKPIEQQKIN